jgi:hypothetical protein
MNILFNRPSTPEAAAIRERIYNVLPAASYQMEKLFGLFDIEFSDETETACVECRATPRLLLNKGFLKALPRDPGPHPALHADRQHRLRCGDQLDALSDRGTHGWHKALHPNQRLRFATRAPVAPAAGLAGRFAQGTGWA